MAGAVSSKFIGLAVELTGFKDSSFCIGGILGLAPSPTRGKESWAWEEHRVNDRTSDPRSAK